MVSIVSFLIILPLFLSCLQYRDYRDYKHTAHSLRDSSKVKGLRFKSQRGVCVFNSNQAEIRIASERDMCEKVGGGEDSGLKAAFQLPKFKKMRYN